jgi:hypothetical protein
MIAEFAGGPTISRMASKLSKVSVRSEGMGRAGMSTEKKPATIAT